MSVKQADGATLQAHMESAARQLGGKSSGLPEAPELPRCVHHIWAKFLNLCGRRGSTGFGASRLTSVELEAWGRLHRQAWTLFEVVCMDRLDDVFMEFAAGQAEGGKGKPAGIEGPVSTSQWAGASIIERRQSDPAGAPSPATTPAGFTDGPMSR